MLPKSDAADALAAWVTERLVKGGTADTIYQELLQKRLDPALAKGVLEIAQEAVRDIGLPEAAIAQRRGRYKPPPPRLPAGPVIHLKDRDVRVVSRLSQPVLAIIDNFLTADECLALIKQSRPRLSQSLTLDNATGKPSAHARRTSQGVWYKRAETALIDHIDKLTMEFLNAPVEFGEDLQVVNYQVGGEFAPHYDFFVDGTETSPVFKNGGQRLCTLLIYLNDVPEGGETVFPRANISIVPRRGSAVYFEYVNEHGHRDINAVHAGMPVLKGDKWIATKWLREHPGRSANYAVHMR